ncbi:MAG: archaeal proteasome endopeptidase complex subunit beta [Candidatus Verstraetearchaeota archaeon]|nr:archaeal proteasome endopeptidase complex subunit beta [Candidatus Verstraetearchaeota archaeon]
MPEAQFGYPVTGATTVGMVCKDGVVLASEKRVAYGFSIMTKSGKKVFPINDRMGVAFAGLISDSQAVLRRLAAEINLYELETHKTMSVKAAAKILANILYAQRAYPVFTETMVGGKEEGGARLFVLDPLGSMIEDKYAALGTGGAVAIGIIESSYTPDLSVSSGRELAVKAVRAAISRDVASGDGIDVLLISREGATEATYPAK